MRKGWYRNHHRLAHPSSTGKRVPVDHAEEIAQLVQDHADATRRAVQAGSDQADASAWLFVNALPIARNKSRRMSRK